jgi:hypothetical protein
LGIKNRMSLNKALLGKWLWRFLQEESSLWGQVIVEKYGVMSGGWCSEEAWESYGVCLWKNIRNEWGTFSNFVSFRVGNGSHIRFWLDVWCREVNLKSSFPELYVIVRDKEALVLDYLESSSSSFHWNPSFIGAVQVWDLESLNSFPSVLLL